MKPMTSQRIYTCRNGFPPPVVAAVAVGVPPDAGRFSFALILSLRNLGDGLEEKMHAIVKAFGGLTAAVGLFLLGIGAVSFFGSTEAVLWRLMLIVGLSSLLSGAMLYCFGAIVAHLAAIRELHERQIELLEANGFRTRRVEL